MPLRFFEFACATLRMTFLRRHVELVETSLGQHSHLLVPLPYWVNVLEILRVRLRSLQGAFAIVHVLPAGEYIRIHVRARTIQKNGKCHFSYTAPQGYTPRGA